MYGVYIAMHLPSRPSCFLRLDLKANSLLMRLFWICLPFERKGRVHWLKPRCRIFRGDIVRICLPWILHA